MADSDILGTQEVLCQELDEIEQRRSRSGTAEFAHEDSETREQRARRLQLNALCLSGSGIYSAAFCLGVLQALAARRMLGQFDYLSTVSGGGFIGGWLQVLIRESQGVEAVEDKIAPPRSDALQRLRAYTNYLISQMGPFSTDTWAGIFLDLGNLLINCAVFVPLFLLITLIPIVYRTAIWVCSDFVWLNLLLLGCAGLALLHGVIRVCSLLPSHREPRSTGDPTPAYASNRSISWGVVYPVLGWTLLIPWLLNFANARLADDVSERPWLAHHAFWLVPAVYFVLMTLAYGLAWGLQSSRSDPGLQLFKVNFGRWIAASFAAALLTFFMLVIAGSVLPLQMIDTATVLTVVAPLALAVVHVLQTALYVALRRENELADLDREWLGRVNAIIQRLAVYWTVFALGCLILPLLVSFVETGPAGDRWSGGRISVMGALSVLVGGTAAWLGKIWPSVDSFVEKPDVLDRVRAYLPTALGVLFAASLLVVFGGVLSLVLAQLQGEVGPWMRLGDAATQPKWLPLILQAVVAMTLFTGVMTFRRVNVNRTSMHAIYRNRLTRAFLGSARNKRDQDPFTGFDPQDNTPLSSLLDAGSSLFPVINTTLNTYSSNSREQRQVGSFTATPLACGSAALRHPSQSATEINPSGAFVPTTRFAGLEGLRLADALTVSGAAMSPNWGYHSSRITAFLMTLFNVRLGIWLPNPSIAPADELRLAQPRNSLKALIDEMLGKTTGDSEAIYLSDGGHFESLGVYEMFRRRCSSILVVDAGADEARLPVGLGNAIRKAEIDLGVTVAMQQPVRDYARDQLEAEHQLTAAALGFAFGDIDYGSGHKGQLLYVKPSFLSQIPADVHAYSTEHETFPHETTPNERLSESQFEGYRMLGRDQMMKLFADAVPGRLQEAFHTGRVWLDKLARSTSAIEEFGRNVEGFAKSVTEALAPPESVAYAGVIELDVTDAMGVSLVGISPPSSAGGGSPMDEEMPLVPLRPNTGYSVRMRLVPSNSRPDPRPSYPIVFHVDVEGVRAAVVPLEIRVDYGFLELPIATSQVEAHIDLETELPPFEFITPAISALRTPGTSVDSGPSSHRLTVAILQNKVPYVRRQIALTLDATDSSSLTGYAARQP